MATAATATEKLIEFEYSAVSSTGQRVDDRMRAPSEEDVYAALARASYTPIIVKKVSNAALGADIGALVGLGAAKLKIGEQAVVVHQLHQMPRAGIPLGKAVTNIAAAYPKPAVAEVLQTVADRIAGGQSLAQAFSGFPRVFNDVFVAYMAAGESSGDPSRSQNGSHASSTRAPRSTGSEGGLDVPAAGLRRDRRPTVRRHLRVLRR